MRLSFHLRLLSVFLCPHALNGFHSWPTWSSSDEDRLLGVSFSLILSWSRTVGVYDKCPFQLTWMLLTHFDKCLFVMMTSDEDGMNKQTRLHGPPPFSLPGSSFFTSLSSCECTGVFDVSRFHAVTEPPVVPLSCFNFAVSANKIHDRTCLPAAHPVCSLFSTLSPSRTHTVYLWHWKRQLEKQNITLSLFF